MKKLFFVLLVPLLFLRARCKEEEPFPVVVPIAKGYQQYFECKVNGQLWRPDTPTLIGWRPVDAQYSPYFGLNILGHNSNGSSIFLAFGPGLMTVLPPKPSASIDKLGKYPLDDANYGLQSLDTTKVRWLEITRIDSVLSYGVLKPVLEGKFSFTSYLGRDTAIVTEGKFGLLWRTF